MSEETLDVYVLLKDVDNYIDLKLGRFPLNIYQQNQIVIYKNKFIEGYLFLRKRKRRNREIIKENSKGNRFLYKGTYINSFG
jgi:hypothetical protein